MSDTDSFIEEVNEEVRRDQLYGYLRRYGWIAALVILGIVGGTAWTEYRKASARADAEALGDALLAALATQDRDARISALQGISADAAEQRAVVQFQLATQQVDNEDTAGAIATLDALAVEGDIAPIYRQIAQFKSLVLQTDITPAAERRQAFEAMAQPGSVFRLLAEEQLALIDVAEGDAEAAIARYQLILSDAEVSQDLQQRALQVIVVLGGEPELNDSPVLQSPTTTEANN